MDELATIRLADLIAKRRQCLEQLCAFAQRQLALVVAGQTAELLRLLAGKERLMAALQRLDQELGPFRGQAPESRQWSSSTARAACAQDADACQALMQQLVELETAAEQAAVARRGDVGAQLGVVHAGGRVRDAYLATQGRDRGAPLKTPRSAAGRFSVDGGAG